MGQIKLVAFDLDGTLFNDKKEVTPETFATLERAAKMGIEIVPATGRFWNAIPEYLDWCAMADIPEGAASTPVMVLGAVFLAKTRGMFPMAAAVA